MKLLRALLFLASFLAGLAPFVAAQTIVHTGDDLAAVVAAASDGDVIEIQSNTEFAGPIEWADKGLTVRAGAGFAPSVRGGQGTAALRLLVIGAVSRATIEGLTLIPGADTLDPLTGLLVTPPAVELNPGFSSFRAELAMSQSTLLGDALIDAKGSSTADVSLFGTAIEGTLICDVDGTSRTIIGAEDCTFDGGIESATGSTSSVRFLIRRCIAHDGLRATGPSLEGTYFAVESSLILGDGSHAVGVNPAVNGGSGLFTNTTISGFTIGAVNNGAIHLTNTAVAGNLTDLQGFAGFDVDHCVFGKSSLSGTGTNPKGSPVFDDNYALLLVSPGLDEGDSQAAFLGPTDVWGAPRIQDNLGLGWSTVNIGAVESTGFLAGSMKTFNGSGTNALAYSAPAPPRVGQVFGAHVDLLPTSVLVAIVLGTQLHPYTLPTIAGEVFVSWTPQSSILFSSTDASVAIPADPSLVGLAVFTQAFRIKLGSPYLITEALNGLDLVIGG